PAADPSTSARIGRFSHTANNNTNTGGIRLRAVGSTAAASATAATGSARLSTRASVVIFVCSHRSTGRPDGRWGAIAARNNGNIRRKIQTIDWIVTINVFAPQALVCGA